MTYTFPFTFTNGTTADATQVNANLAGAAADWELAFGRWTTIYERTAAVNTALYTSSGAVHLFCDRVMASDSSGYSPAATLSAASWRGAYGFLDPADYAAGPRTARFRVRATVTSNNGPVTGQTFTFGLYATSLSGTGSNMTIAPTTLIAGTGTAFVTPIAQNMVSANSASFAMTAQPVAFGFKPSAAIGTYLLTMQVQVSTQ